MSDGGLVFCGVPLEEAERWVRDYERITRDEQTETQRREARKFASSLAGDVSAYHTALYAEGDE